METLEEAMKGVDNHIKGLKDVRGRIISLHLDIEYWINEILKEFFEKPDFIINLKFYTKFKILEALNILDEDTLINLKKLNEIRNRLAHTNNLDDIKEDIENKIKEMKIHRIEGHEDYIIKGKLSLEVACYNTIANLHTVLESLCKFKEKNKIPNKHILGEIFSKEGIVE